MLIWFFVRVIQWAWMKNVNCFSRSPRRRMRWYSVISATSAYIRLVLLPPSVPPSLPFLPPPSPSSLFLPPPSPSPLLSLSASLLWILPAYIQYWIPNLIVSSFLLPSSLLAPVFSMLSIYSLSFFLSRSDPTYHSSLPSILDWVIPFSSFSFSQCILSSFSC